MSSGRGGWGRGVSSGGRGGWGYVPKAQPTGSSAPSSSSEPTPAEGSQKFTYKKSEPKKVSDPIERSKTAAAQIEVCHHCNG